MLRTAHSILDVTTASVDGLGAKDGSETDTWGGSNLRGRRQGSQVAPRQRARPPKFVSYYLPFILKM